MEKFFSAVQNMFKIPKLRTRILFTLGMLAIYRFGAHVSAPGINKDQLERVWNEVAGTLLGVLDLFSGGNFRTISVFALGVTPYITASIIMQLMPVLSPAVKKIQEEGEVGRQKLNQWTRYRSAQHGADVFCRYVAQPQRHHRRYLAGYDHGRGHADDGNDLRNVAR
jgi:preprotein translocase subunit SecY